MRRNKSGRLTFILYSVYRTLKKIEKLVEYWNPVMRKLQMYWLYGLDASKWNIYIDVLCANEVVSGRWRSICTVQPFYYICEDIVSWKFGRTYVLSIWINIGNNQENSHSHHKIKCQLIVFMFVFVKKYKINHSQDHVWKP